MLEAIPFLILFTILNSLSNTAIITYIITTKYEKYKELKEKNENSNHI